MKVKNKISPVMVGIIVTLFVSCSSIGHYLPISSSDIVIGTIQTTFVARDTWLSNNESISAQVYIKLLEAAAQRYSGNIDIRDIVWGTGRKISPRDTEVSATAKVIKVEQDETNY